MFIGCGLILLIISYLFLPSYLFNLVWALLISVGMLCCPSISDLSLICISVTYSLFHNSLPFCPSHSLLHNVSLKECPMVILHHQPEECQPVLRLHSAWLQTTCPALSWTISLNISSLQLSDSIHCLLSVHLCTLSTLSEMLLLSQSIEYQ